MGKAERLLSQCQLLTRNRLFIRYRIAEHIGLVAVKRLWNCEVGLLWNL